MDGDLLLPVVVRWAHVLSAVALVGGILFIRWVLVPAFDTTLTDEERARLSTAIHRRWAMLIGILTLLLLVSGVYNFMTIGLPKGRTEPLYHSLFGIKFLAAIGVFFLAAALAGRASVFEGLRRKSHLWLWVATLLGIAVVLLSGVLRHLG